jgi:DNA-directed RNA polymerase specialized sigma24 family protein
LVNPEVNPTLNPTVNMPHSSVHVVIYYRMYGSGLRGGYLGERTQTANRRAVMKNPFKGLLEDQHVRVITLRARALGFRSQDLDEVVQLTAIRLARTDVRDDAMLIAATNESGADVNRRESREVGRVERLQELAATDEVDSTEGAIAESLDVRDCVKDLSTTNRTICDYLSRGWSTREIARVLGITCSAVHQRMRRMRRQFVERGIDGMAV